MRNIGPQNTATAARNLFSTLIGAAQNPDMTQDPTLDFQSLVNPEFAGGAFQGQGAIGANQAFNLARAAAADRLGAFTANRFLPSGSRGFNQLQSEFAGSDALPEQGSYLKFLQNRFGL